MTEALKWLLLWVVAINIVAFFLYGVDKRRAKRHAWRIPEAVLLGIAVAGGSIGAITGMFLFRHKTRHPAFRIGLPAILLLQIVFVILLLQ